MDKLTPQYPDVGRHRQELVNCPVIGRSSIRVADRDRKELEELFARGRISPRDDCRRR
jgi:hypothetical protein